MKTVVEETEKMKKKQKQTRMQNFPFMLCTINSDAVQ